jgi:hypothetical protein
MTFLPWALGPLLPRRARRVVKPLHPGRIVKSRHGGEREQVRAERGPAFGKTAGGAA